ncbi:MAG: ComEA family DNA-binding protein [Sandaracinaceae bacterium]
MRGAAVCVVLFVLSACGSPPPSERGAQAPGECSPGTATRGHPVDVNAAGVAELMTLPGIGRAEADEIVWRRETYGPAFSLSELATESRGGSSGDNGEPSLLDANAIDCLRDYATLSVPD